MAVGKDPQAGLWDREVSDPELENALEEMQESQEASQTFGKARSRMYARVKEHDLKAGERIRVGQFVIKGRTRNGGGFRIPAWSKVTAEVVQESGTLA